MQLRDFWQRPIRLNETDADGFRRSWIMLMPLGDVSHPDYGELHFTKAKLCAFKENFDGRVRKIDIALDADHQAAEKNSRATGWIERLAFREDVNGQGGGLWGLVCWTPYGADFLINNEYRYFSPEFGTYTDEETGQAFENVIIGGALTNRPFLKSMPAISLAERRRQRRAAALAAAEGNVADKTIKLASTSKSTYGTTSAGKGRKPKASAVADYDPSDIDDATAFDDADDSSSMDDTDMEEDDPSSIDDDEAESYDDADMDANDSSSMDDGGDSDSDTAEMSARRLAARKMAAKRMAARKMAANKLSSGRKALMGPGGKTPRKMSEAQVQGQVYAMREQMAEMRVQLYERQVDDIVSGISAGLVFKFSETHAAIRDPRTGKPVLKQARMALSPRATAKLRAWLLDEGVKLSESRRNGVLDVIQTIITDGLIDLSVRGSSYDTEDRRTIPGGHFAKTGDVQGMQLTEAAERAAGRDGKVLSALDPQEKLRYFVLAERETGIRL